MKRIGIATIHKSSNFGGSLQAYALYKYLESQGHNVEIIDLLRPVHERFVYDRRYKPYRNSRFSLKNRLREAIKKVLGYKDDRGYASEISKQHFNDFFKNIKYSKEYRKVRYIYKDAPQYDIYISGSDQLWSPMHPFCIEPFFLTFAPKGSKKISYATSIGVTELTDREKVDFKRWLESYEAISVREAEGKLLLDSFIKDKNIEVVADPTFLLDINDWKNLAITPSIKESYILLFSLSNNKPLVDFAIKMSKESGKKLVILKGPTLDANSSDYILDNSIGPREFLGYFDNADMIITDSFHGSVFSMLMGAKNFFSYIQPVSKTGSRITNLLNTVGQPHHLLPSDLEKSYKELDNEKVDKIALYKRIAEVREHAREFLKRNI